MSPQIFRGASNSNNIGCDINISLHFKHKALISVSDRRTSFPGFYPFTDNSRDIIESTSTSISVF